MASATAVTEQLENGRGSRPVPDPTLLTTQQLLRESLGLKELIFTRLDGYDRAIALLQANADRSPTVGVVEQTVKSNRELNEERFRSIAIQFAERDTRTEQTSRDSKVAVDAALQAAKEAVGEQNKSSALAIAKSEASTTKQIDQIAVLISTGTAGTNDKIDDLKTRLTAVEGRSQGSSSSATFIFQIIAAVASLAAVVSVVSLLMKASGH